ncbi:TetR/AcrR family transcriptional regulator [Parasphingorhabdus litoris]|uniref:TetR/AcrR family transcriptional regulator n=1 Tax=Parasphingorhabdus litoris TaxID=394733 RepID=A0ABN1AGK6_9SPHN
MEAACKQFFNHGFAATSIEAIAADAGVSKVTIYNRFGGKEGLFTAAVENECDNMQHNLSIDMDDELSLREQLVTFGDNMIRFLERPEITRMEVHLPVEVEENPALGKLFLDAGPRRMLRFLSRLLSESAKRGEITVSDPDQAAELLAGMFKGMADLDRRFGQLDPATAQQQTDKRIKSAVDLFLRSHQSQN